MLKIANGQMNKHALNVKQATDEQLRLCKAKKSSGWRMWSYATFIFFGTCLAVQAKVIDPPPYPDDPSPAPMPDPLPIRKGMTWTVLGQQGQSVHVGSDAKTNPYAGDTSIDTYLPILCVLVDGRGAPGGINFDFYNGWVKGAVQTTPAYPGVELTSRQQGDVICDATFGPGWHLAEFHDASGGWSYWATKGETMTFTPGSRFWAAISNQPANPWNSYGQVPVLNPDINKPAEATCSLPTTDAAIDPVKAQAEACPGEPGYVGTDEGGNQASIMAPPGDGNHDQVDDLQAAFPENAEIAANTVVDAAKPSAATDSNPNLIEGIGTVGVIKGEAGCGGFPEYFVYLDNEDSFNANKRGGWIGATDSNRNTKISFCAVDAEFFNLAAQSGAQFAVLHILGLCPNGTSSFDRIHNDEWNDNRDTMSMPVGSYTKIIKKSSGGYVPYSYFNMSFCVSKGYTPNQVTNAYFPDLGFSYGVFGGANGIPSWALNSGFIHMDDEDGSFFQGIKNDNQPKYMPSYTGFFVAGGKNTTYSMLSVKVSKNLAYSATASASSTYCSGGPANCYSPERIKDGSKSTALGGTNSWANAVYPNPPQWVQLAWNSQSIFSRIELFTTQDYPIRDFVMQYRTQGNTWANIPGPIFPTNNTNSHLTFIFPSIASNAIRVLCSSGPLNQQGYCRVNELEVYK